MAINYPGPYELRLQYTCSISSVVLEHEARYNVELEADPDPGETFDNINVLTRNNPPEQLDTAVDAWVALLDDLFNSSNTSFVLAELWKYEPLSFDASFVGIYDISAPGTSGSANTGAGQTIYVFRTAEGGIMKLATMEGIQSGLAPLSYAGLTVAQKALVDWVLGDGNFFIGRDTSEPIAFKGAFPGQNEAVFKRRYRA